MATADKNQLTPPCIQLRVMLMKLLGEHEAGKGGVQYFRYGCSLHVSKVTGGSIGAASVDISTASSLKSIMLFPVVCCVLLQWCL